MGLKKLIIILLGISYFQFGCSNNPDQKIIKELNAYLNSNNINGINTKKCKLILIPSNICINCLKVPMKNLSDYCIIYSIDESKINRINSECKYQTKDEKLMSLKCCNYQPTILEINNGIIVRNEKF